jgi:predicted amidohydrolase YtcJ
MAHEAGKGKWILSAIASAALTAGCGSGSDDPPAIVADAVFTNGKVVTVDGRSTIAQAFAVKDGKFITVGSSDQVQRHVGANTQVTNLNGRTVIPGLSDNHFHSAGGGPGIALAQVRSLAELQAKIAERAASSAPGTILVS